MNYEQLVKALTCGNDGKLPCHNNECPYWVDQWHGIGLCNVIKKDADAAAAIEALEAEVERLKDANDELREAQTYIDNYGDKWMTSAKDVPTAAYNHGYMDGKNEAEQALEPKRGEWIHSVSVQGTTSGGITYYHGYTCSVCGGLMGRKGDAYCYKCGAKMTEVQE